jgi:hypothetical protein
LVAAAAAAGQGWAVGRATAVVETVEEAAVRAAVRAAAHPCKPNSPPASSVACCHAAARPALIRVAGHTQRWDCHAGCESMRTGEGLGGLGGRFHQKGGGGGLAGTPGGTFGGSGGFGGGLGGIRYTVCAAANSVLCKPKPKTTSSARPRGGEDGERGADGDAAHCHGVLASAPWQCGGILSPRHPPLLRAFNPPCI